MEPENDGFQKEIYRVLNFRGVSSCRINAGPFVPHSMESTFGRIWEGGGIATGFWYCCQDSYQVINECRISLVNLGSLLLHRTILSSLLTVDERHRSIWDAEKHRQLWQVWTASWISFINRTNRFSWRSRVSASKNPQPPGETCIKLLEFPSTKVMSTSATPRDIFPLMLSHHHPVLLPIFHPPNASNCLRRSKTREKTYKSTFLMMIQLTFESHYKRRLFDAFWEHQWLIFHPLGNKQTPLAKIIFKSACEGFSRAPWRNSHAWGCDALQWKLRLKSGASSSNRLGVHWNGGHYGKNDGKPTGKFVWKEVTLDGTRKLLVFPSGLSTLSHQKPSHTKTSTCPKRNFTFGNELLPQPTQLSDFVMIRKRPFILSQEKIPLTEGHFCIKKGHCNLHETRTFWITLMYLVRRWNFQVWDLAAPLHPPFISISPPKNKHVPWKGAISKESSLPTIIF